MRVTGKVYSEYAARVRAILDEYPEAATSYRNANLSFTRFLWDVASRAGTAELYREHDCNDSHIQTATKRALHEYGVTAW